MKFSRHIFLAFFLFLILVFDQNIKSQTSVKLNVNQASELNADAGQDVSIDVGNSNVLGGSPTASGGTGNYLYQWSPVEYLTNSETANPTVSPPGNVNFSLTVTDEKGCSATDDVLVIVIGGTPVNEAYEDSYFRIFPNPSTGKFTISISNFTSPEVKIIIFNITGQIIYQDLIRNTDNSINTDIDISDFSKGSYFIRIEGDSDTIHKQLIIK